MGGSLFCVFLWKNFLFLRFSWLSLLTIIVGCFVILAVYLRSTYSLLTTPRIVYDPKNSVNEQSTNEIYLIIYILRNI